MTITREELYDWINAKFRPDTACGKGAKLGALNTIDKIYPELERLEKENKEMREALEKAAEFPFDAYTSYLADIAQMKRYCQEALAKYPRPRESDGE